MPKVEYALSMREYSLCLSDDPRYVEPWEFIEKPAPEPWPDESDLREVAGLKDRPGARLAEVLDDTDPNGLDDDELLTTISAWRRLGAWAKAGELSAVAAFLEKRTQSRSGNQAFESAVSELELELTLTAHGSGRLLELACPLTDHLPDTLEALRTGLIDEAKARVIARAVDGIASPATAATVERQVLPKAPHQTTGQLRAATERAVITADPDAADRRRKHAEARRRVEIRPTDAHTADLAGRDLPADQALAADNRITALAKALKRDGDSRSLTFLRAQTFLSLLLGTGPAPTWPPKTELPDAPEHPDDQTAPDTETATATADEEPHQGAPVSARTMRFVPDARGGSTRGDLSGLQDGLQAPEGSSPGVPGAEATGTVHVIIPICTLLGTCAYPGEVPGYGPIPAPVARRIATGLSGRRWCYSVLDTAGRAIAHGHTRTHTDDIGYRTLLSDITDQIHCSHRDGTRPDRSEKYRPRDSLRHLIETRDRTCRFPNCRRPAQKCDLDHTIPYDKDGPTCACNMAPLCRKHHQIKQSTGWTLIQPEPGTLLWTTPSGRRYHVVPDPYLE